MQHVEIISELSMNGLQRIKRLYHTLQNAFYSQCQLPLSQWIETTWKNLGGLFCLIPDRESLEDVRLFFDELEKCDIKNIALLESKVNAKFSNKNSSDANAVQLMTIHKAKGLEFKYVFVVNLVEDRFPARRRSEGIEIPIELVKEQLPEGDSHYQEERRLFYVAITRAKDKLYLMSSEDYGGSRTKKISRFLAELGFERLETNKTTNRFDDPKAQEEKKGKFVYHLPDAFSFSQIKSYSTCPYQYKLAHLLKIPTKGSASFSFGQSIHATMQKFYERLKDLNSVSQDSLFDASAAKNKAGKIKAPTLDELLAFYDQLWIEDWYSTKSQREEYRKLGNDILRDFYKSQEENWTIPVSLESWFKIKVGEHLIHGRIDRVDQLTNGSLEIIDYKTGKAKEKDEGDDKDQLLIYQMALQQLPEYRNIGAPSKLTYYYLNENAQVSFLGNEKEITKLQEKLVSTIDEIKSGNFDATPSQHTCKYCDFKNICQYRM